MFDFNKDAPTLRQLVNVYRDYRTAGPDYYSHLRTRVDSFCAWAGYDVTPDDLNPTLEQAWANELVTRGLAPYTIRGYFRNLHAVASLKREIQEGKLVLPKCELATLEAYETHEIRKLLKRAKQLKGRYKNGVKKRYFWIAAIHCAYSLGVRAGDLFDIPVNLIDGDGYCDWTQNKTGVHIRLRFSKKAMKAIRKHGFPMIVPWAYSRHWFEKEFEQLRNEAGVLRGTWKWIRRSAGSYADADGRGHELLGNTRAVFEKHYRVPKIAGDEPPPQKAI